VAQVLAEGEVAGFYRPLLQLMQDEEPAVQRAALLAAAKLKQPKLWPTVVHCLGVPQLRATAVTALVSGGEAVVPYLDAAITQPGQDRQVLIRLAQILGRIGGEQARNILQKQLDYPDEQVRTQILLALNQCDYQADSNVVTQIQDMLQAELAQAAWLVACLVDLDQTEATVLLRTSLAAHLTRHRLRVLLWLSFLYDPQTIRQVQDALGLGRSLNSTLSVQTNRQKPYALETLDVLLPVNQKTMILPLAEGLPPEQLHSRLKPHFSQQSCSSETRLQEILTGPERWLTPWIKAAALDAVACLPALTLSDIVASLLSSPDPVIRETALLTLHRLGSTQIEDYLDKLADDPNPQIAALARQLTAPQEVDTLNLSAVEKVVALKTFSFFADISYEILAEIAATLQEETVRAGEPIYRKGYVGHSVYIITAGEVRIHNGQQTIARLNPHESFGEMSILDPAPGSTSATALKDSHLLRLDQTLFREILTDHSEVSWQVIQILVQRLRQTQNQAGSQRDPANLLGFLKKKLAVHDLERGL
jgi:HEAT repeat protein